MPEPIHLADHDPSGDAARRGVRAMLQRALADLDAGAAPAAARAVLVLGWLDSGGGLHVRPYAAGVDLISAVGLLDLGQMELYTGGPDGGDV